MDPDQSSLIWTHTVCKSILKHFSRRQQQTTFITICFTARYNIDLKHESASQLDCYACVNIECIAKHIKVKFDLHI